MNLIYSLASTTLISTIVIVGVLLSVPLLDKKYAVNGRYLLWIVIMATMMLPFVPLAQEPIFEVNMPVTVATHSPAAVSSAPPVLSPNMENLPNTLPEILQEAMRMVIPAAADYARTFDISEIILLIWLVGVVASVVFQVARHFLFRNFVRRWSVAETDPAIVKLLHDEMNRMDISKPMRLYRCKGIKAPMLIGLATPAILLTYAEYNDTDLSLIFRHELTHYKRRDLWYKLALMAVKALYWFNPAVHFMAKQANKDMEIICDMLTIRGMDIVTRKSYCELILSMATDTPKYKTGLSTCINGGKEMLKQRFANILGSNKKRGIVAFVTMGVAIAIASVFIGFNFAATSPDNDRPYILITPLHHDYDMPSNEDILEEWFSGWSPVTDTIHGRAIDHMLTRYEPMPAGYIYQFQFGITTREYPEITEMTLFINNEYHFTESIFGTRIHPTLSTSTRNRYFFEIEFEVTAHVPIESLDLIVDDSLNVRNFQVLTTEIPMPMALPIECDEFFEQVEARLADTDFMPDSPDYQLFPELPPISFFTNIVNLNEGESFGHAERLADMNIIPDSRDERWIGYYSAAGDPPPLYAGGTIMRFNERMAPGFETLPSGKVYHIRFVLTSRVAPEFDEMALFINHEYHSTESILVTPDYIESWFEPGFSSYNTEIEFEVTAYSPIETIDLIIGELDVRSFGIFISPVEV